MTFCLALLGCNINRDINSNIRNNIHVVHNHILLDFLLALVAMLGDINRNIMYMRGGSGVGIISMSGLSLEQCSIHIINLMQDLSRKYIN